MICHSFQFLPNFVLLLLYEKLCTAMLHLMHVLNGVNFHHRATRQRFPPYMINQFAGTIWISVLQVTVMELRT